VAVVQYTCTHKQYRKVTKQTTQRTQKYIEQHKKYIEQHNNLEECGPCPVFADFTLAFALQLRKKHGKTSVSVRRRSTAPIFLCLGTKRKWVVNCRPQPLYPQERTPIPFEQEDGRAPVPVWTYWRREKLLAPSRVRT